MKAKHQHCTKKVKIYWGWNQIVGLEERKNGLDLARRRVSTGPFSRILEVEINQVLPYNTLGFQHIEVIEVFVFSKIYKKSMGLAVSVRGDPVAQPHLAIYLESASTTEKEQLGGGEAQLTTASAISSRKMKDRTEPSHNKSMKLTKKSHVCTAPPTAAGLSPAIVKLELPPHPDVDPRRLVWVLQGGEHRDGDGHSRRAHVVYFECWRGAELRLEAKPVFSAEDGTPNIEKLRKADRCDTRPSLGTKGKVCMVYWRAPTMKSWNVFGHESICSSTSRGACWSTASRSLDNKYEELISRHWILGDLSWNWVNSTDPQGDHLPSMWESRQSFLRAGSARHTKNGTTQPLKETERSPNHLRVVIGCWDRSGTSGQAPVLKSVTLILLAGVAGGKVGGMKVLRHQKDPGQIRIMASPVSLAFPEISRLMAMGMGANLSSHPFMQAM
ncbi:hypothetical protein B0H14DRAFT_2626269 [Mycena olivaceomarginata]|nr:hypothetical protein B0H14DRAFT_2626269 [Mycena olivaceomarginata]